MQNMQSEKVTLVYCQLTNNVKELAMQFKSILLAAACVGAALSVSATPCAAGALRVGNSVENTTGGFTFADGTTQTTAYSGGAGGGVTLTSPDSSILVGGSSTAPTARLNFILTDSFYAPVSDSPNYAPAAGSPNYAPAAGSPSYVDKSGDTMTGALSLPANGLQMAGNQIVMSGGRLGYGAAPSPLALFNIAGSLTAQTTTAHLLQVDGTVKSNPNVGQAYLRGVSIYPTFDLSAGYANYLMGVDTHLGLRVGANVAHSVVGYHLNGQPTGGIGCSVGFGISVPNQQAGLCNGRYGIYQGDGANAQYNYFASNVGIGTPFPSQALTVQGNAQISGSLTAGSLTAESLTTGSLNSTGTLSLPANGLQMAGNQIVMSGGRFGYGAAPSSQALFNIAGSLTAPTTTGHLLQVDGTVKSNPNVGQAYLRGVSIYPTFDLSEGYANYLMGVDTHLGQVTGTNVAHSVVGYHINGQPTGGLECSVGFGISVPNQQTGLCNGKYGIYQGDGANAQYNYFASNVGIGTPFPSQALTVQGNAQISGNVSASGTGTMPVYDSTGASQSAPHMVTGTVAVNGSGTVSLAGAAAFSSSTSYSCTATMQASSPAVFAVGVQNLSGSSFVLFGSFAGNVNYHCVGT